MGFEISSSVALYCRYWYIIAVLLQTQGSASMQIQGNGYQQILSAPLNTTHLAEKNKVKVDLYVGNTQPNPYWIDRRNRLSIALLPVFLTVMLDRLN